MFEQNILLNKWLEFYYKTLNFKVLPEAQKNFLSTPTRIKFKDKNESTDETTNIIHIIFLIENNLLKFLIIKNSFGVTRNIKIFTLKNNCIIEREDNLNIDFIGFFNLNYWDFKLLEEYPDIISTLNVSDLNDLLILFNSIEQFKYCRIEFVTLFNENHLSSTLLGILRKCPYQLNMIGGYMQKEFNSCYLDTGKRKFWFFNLEYYFNLNLTTLVLKFKKNDNIKSLNFTETIEEKIVLISCLLYYEYDIFYQNFGINLFSHFSLTNLLLEAFKEWKLRPNFYLQYESKALTWFALANFSGILEIENNNINDILNDGKFNLENTKEIYKYDINSAFSYASLGLFPIKPGHFTKDYTLDKNIGAFCLVEIDVKNEFYIPCRIISDNKVYYPIGKFFGVYLSDELIQLTEMGVNITIFESYVFYSKETIDYEKKLKKYTHDYIFKEFTEKIYSLRIESENKLVQHLYKTSINSIFGKFSSKLRNTSKISYNDTQLHEYSNEFKVNYQTINSSDGTITTVKTTKADLTAPNGLHIGAMITAYNRIYFRELIFKLKKKYPTIVFYKINTDGFYCNINLNLEEDNSLGALRLDKVERLVFFSLKNIFSFDKMSLLLNNKYIESFDVITAYLQNTLADPSAWEKFTKHSYKKKNINSSNYLPFNLNINFEIDKYLNKYILIKYEITKEVKIKNKDRNKQDKLRIKNINFHEYVYIGNETSLEKKLNSKINYIYNKYKEFNKDLLNNININSDTIINEDNWDKFIYIKCYIYITNDSGVLKNTWFLKNINNSSEYETYSILRKFLGYLVDMYNVHSFENYIVLNVLIMEKDKYYKNNKLSEICVLESLQINP